MGRKYIFHGFVTVFNLQNGFNFKSLRNNINERRGVDRPKAR